MQDSNREAVRPPLGIAFEGDLGTRLDALLAVAMLNGLTARGVARRISLGVSRSSLRAAQLADVVAEFYATLPAGFGTSTIGMPEGEPARQDAPALAAMLSLKAPDGAPLYSSTIGRVEDTANDAILVRNTILGEYDGNAAIVLAGPATGLVRLLDLYGARAQILAKVKYLVVALGSFPLGAADPDIASDPSAARRLFAEWPTPIIAVGSEVGKAVPYPSSSIEAGLAGSPAHPVAAAWRALAPKAYAAPTTALAAVLQAAQPDQGHFQLSEPGTISVLDDGRTRFVAGKGSHRHLILAPARRADLSALYVALVSAAPAPRPVRRPREMAVAPVQPAASTPAEVRTP
jgi:hypothetical protein